MNSQINTIHISLEPLDNPRLSNLCGPFNEHLKQIERRLGVEINQRGNNFSLAGDTEIVKTAVEVLRDLYKSTEHEVLSADQVNFYLQESGIDDLMNSKDKMDIVIQTPRLHIRPRGKNQNEYVRNIQKHDLVFGVGPAGTGKTYLAVACAVSALSKGTTNRLVLIRPAVEAGERLGFLPGDLSQKIDPYLRPMYDALYEMLGFEKVSKLIERHVIEVTPLAYMRGRTLNDAFIFLDEAQNTTQSQMKMFLTRIGFGSQAVVNGDITQIDLPSNLHSGLKHAKKILSSTDDIKFNYFTNSDVVRHSLVKSIVKAYDLDEKNHKK